MKPKKERIIAKINFCPNCGGKLKDKSTLGQNVKECSECGVRFFILVTSTPFKNEEALRE